MQAWKLINFTVRLLCASQDTRQTLNPSYGNMAARAHYHNMMQHEHIEEDAAALQFTIIFYDEWQGRAMGAAEKQQNTDGRYTEWRIAI